MGECAPPLLELLLSSSLLLFFLLLLLLLVLLMSLLLSRSFSSNFPLTRSHRIRTNKPRRVAAAVMRQAYAEGMATRENAILAIERDVHAFGDDHDETESEVRGSISSDLLGKRRAISD